MCCCPRLRCWRWKRKRGPKFDLSALTRFFNTSHRFISLESDGCDCRRRSLPRSYSRMHPPAFCNTDLSGTPPVLSQPSSSSSLMAKGQPALFYIVPSLLIRARDCQGGEEAVAGIEEEGEIGGDRWRLMSARPILSF
mmetsp:Transcript_56411/g.65902  ORF Transcript_56411/g.65902 Transcript_56411/m.65902 type:complete len:138 (+) Transcript_56411:225-638(+)